LNLPERLQHDENKGGTAMSANAFRISRWIFMALFVVLTLALSAYAVNAAKEAATAADHAGFAAKATTIQQVHMHLHHALNCLVGPKGEGFDLSAENPCASLGSGAIPDDTSASAEYSLRSAVKDLTAGLASNDLATAQKDAAQAEAELKKMM
jgi:hypothetical protein